MKHAAGTLVFILRFAILGLALAFVITPTPWRLLRPPW